MDKMLISGGNGFLGSHPAERAIREGLNVTVLDDFSTSNRVNVPAEVTIIKELAEDASIQDNFEYIVHLAARPSLEVYINYPVETLMSNSVGTMKLLELAMKGKSRFIFTSSSEVYSNAGIMRTAESYYDYVSSCGIRSCYDEGKRYSEALTMEYHRKFGLDTRIQRPFNVYVPRIRPDGLYGKVVPRFIQQALNGENITIHGDGKQTSSFLYIDDWVDATWRMLTMDDLNGGIFNIGPPDEITILELANLIVKKVCSSSNIVHVEKREDDPQRRSADINKAKEILGWMPETSLDSGMHRTIEWIRGDVK